jgi:hypothetical protein
MNLDFEWESVDAFIRFLKEIAPSFSALLEPHPPDVREETWAAIGEAISPHAAPDGKLRLSNLVLVAVGRA